MTGSVDNDALAMPSDDLNQQKNLLVLQHNTVTRGIDRFINWVGEVFSWLWLLLLGVIIGNVILRYVFSQGMIELEELQWYLYAAAWLVGLSYTFVHDGHVRADVVHEKLRTKIKLGLELAGLAFLFMPFVLFVLYQSLPFVALSWATGETSTSANGLGARWLVKGCLTFSFLLLFLVGTSRCLRVILTLKNGPADQRGGLENDH